MVAPCSRRPVRSWEWVFAKSLDDEQTGYALTVAEAMPVLQGAAAAAGAVSTGACQLS